MKLSVSRLSPPGMDISPQKRYFIFAAIISFVWSLYFCVMCSAAFRDLFYYERGVRVALKENAKMPAFWELYGRSWLGFVFFAVCALGFVIYNYAYYKQGSKSVYLMRRLPQKWEMHLRALFFPVLIMLALLLIGLAVTLIYFGLYLLVTPDTCFAPTVRQIIWG